MEVGGMESGYTQHGDDLAAKCVIWSDLVDDNGRSLLRYGASLQHLDINGAVLKRTLQILVRNSVNLEVERVSVIKRGLT